MTDDEREFLDWVRKFCATAAEVLRVVALLIDLMRR